MISFAIAIIFRIIYLIIILTCLLSWVPIFDPDKQPIAGLLKIYDKIMSPFRGKIPPIAGLDFSPMIVFILLMILETLLYRVLGIFGL